MSTPNKVGFTSATAGLLTDVDSVAVGGATNIYRNIPGTFIADDAGNEYLYMLGVAATVAGSFVTYNSVTFQTALTTNSATNAGPVAIAMAAILAAQYGWYLIGGTYASANVATTFGATTASGVMLAGAFHTPRVASLVVHRPAITPLGGATFSASSRISSVCPISGSAFLR